MRKPSSIFRSLATLMSGSLLAQLVSLAAYPVVTRLFSPADFGLFNIFYSYVEVLVILSTGKYELALPIASDDREARALLRFARWLNAAVSALLLAVVAVLLLADALPGRSRELGLIALLLPWLVFFMGSARIHSFLFNRYERYGAIASSALTGSLSACLLKIVAGLLVPLAAFLSRLGLPLATVAGQAAADAVYLLGLRRLPAPADKPSWGECRAAARRFRNFPFYTLPKDFISSFSFNLPFIWLALYFDNALIGLFSLALTFSFRPVNMVCADLERVLYVRAQQAVAEGRRVWRELRPVAGWLAVVALPVAAVLMVVAEPLFVWVFGAEWAGCGWYVRWLLPWTVLSLFSGSLCFVPNLFFRQRGEMLFYVVLLALRAAAVGAGVWLHDFKLAIALFSLSGLAVSAALLVWYAALLRRHDRKNKS